VPTRAERDAELAFERDQLVKAELDISQGWSRYNNQRDLVTSLQARGQDTVHAMRLAELLLETLQQWETHRRLIEQRIEHLEGLNRTPIPN
jgi:hypothetical protein